MAQGGQGDRLKMSDGHLARAIQRCKGTGGAHQCEFAAQAIRAEGKAEFGGFFQHCVRHDDRCKTLAASNDLSAHGIILTLPLRDKSRRVLIKGVAAFHSLDARLDVGRGSDVEREAEPVEQLRAKIAFFGIAGADQHKARRMSQREAIALDHVLAGGRHIQQKIDQMILQQFTSST